MQNFDNKITTTEKSLKSIRGIFDKNNVENRLKEIEKLYKKKIFGKIKF